MGEFSFRCVSGPHRAGSLSYAMTQENRPRGRVCRVDFDSKAWFYRVDPGEVVAFKRWVLSVFPGNTGERYRVVGAFPYYDVEIAR